MTSQERTDKQATALHEVSELCKQMLGGMVTLDEFLNKATHLRMQTPSLLAGDVDPATGLKVPTLEEFQRSLDASFKGM